MYCGGKTLAQIFISQFSLSKTLVNLIYLDDVSSCVIDIGSFQTRAGKDI